VRDTRSRPCWSRKGHCNEHRFRNRRDPAPAWQCRASVRFGDARQPPATNSTQEIYHLGDSGHLRLRRGGGRCPIRHSAEPCSAQPGAPAPSHRPERANGRAASRGRPSGRGVRDCFGSARACGAGSGAAHASEPGSRAIEIGPGRAPKRGPDSAAARCRSAQHSAPQYGHLFNTRFESLADQPATHAGCPIQAVLWLEWDPGTRSATLMFYSTASMTT
jgi:hypothetical protein